MDLFQNAERESNFERRLNVYLSRPNKKRKCTQKEIVMHFLSEHPHSWYYIWEIMGEKPLGWVSHKVDDSLSILERDGKVEARRIGKYAVYSIK